MKRAVVTQAFGDKWMEVLAVTRPRMESYCKRHNIDFIVIEKPLTQPTQYTKSAIANIMVSKGYGQVTFFDADILVAEDCEDIGQDAGVFCAFDEGQYLDRRAGMVKLAGDFGGIIEGKFYVNTGVFVASTKVMGAFSLPPLGLFPDHFGEQTWLNIMLHLWGVTPVDLDPSFNCMTSVESHFGLDRHKDAQIIHYAGQSNDLDKLVKQIKEDDAKLKELDR